MPRPTVLKGPFLLDQEAGHYRIRCPGCGTEGTIDFEQYTGRVSIQCPTEGCGYHETHDLSRAEEVS